ncbi:hypothetical protein EJ03DRAFT_325697 [Teratosphaeria nubilosa]|uniref:LsmAD domain-containing protein n=1 Tax=Teratosphaeria nubilosa TaxID=161662 RepID=A0A6G1LFP5_9PEZI|nr:hypothetical protein EJ03DRAFT_325697 [Teratosphaeria nubilosa]
MASKDGARANAWFDPNRKITKSRTNHNASSTPNGVVAPSTQPKAPELHMHDRLSYLVTAFVGKDATLTLRSQEQYTGIFSGMAKDKYTMKMVRRTKSPSSQQSNGVTEAHADYVGEGDDHVMNFDVQDTVDLAVENVSTAFAKAKENGTVHGFRTDTEIGSDRSAARPFERPLQKWDGGLEGEALEETALELSSSGRPKIWDQFEENSKKFGVTTSWDEEMYTTSINYSDPQYAQKAARAERLAREIEGTATTDKHVLEERGMNNVHGDGLDEEDKYSGVKRDAPKPLEKRGQNAYVPPSQRPITKAPTVPGAPFDPAIISSQIRSTPSPSSSAVAQKASEPAAAISHALIPPKPSITATASSSREPSASGASQPATKKPEQTTEDHMRRVADAFKEFSSNEKFKIKQAQESKRQVAKQEKNVRLNDLKKFAANFKLNSRVPDDLVPILAKDSEKQREIQRRADEAAKDAEKKAEERKKSGSSAASPAQPNASGKTDLPVGAVQTAKDRMEIFSRESARHKMNQQLRQPFPQPGPSPRGSATRQGPGFARIGFPQPLPADLKIPPPAAAGAAGPSPLSPPATAGLSATAKPFNINAPSFTPGGGTSPSPQRLPSIRKLSTAKTSGTFFDDRKKRIDAKDRKNIKEAFNPVKRMLGDIHDEAHKKSIEANGGIPKAWHTAPTWAPPAENTTVSYKDGFPKALPTVSSQGPSPMHTPVPSGGAGPPAHFHQLPNHMQGPPMGAPHQGRPYYPAQPGPHGPAHFPPQMHGQFGPNGSVQNSPRFNPAQVAFNGQMGGMPQFGGQMMQPYGMSPSSRFAQPSMAMNPGQPFMLPLQQPGQMPHVRPGGFNQGPQMMPQMGGQVMMPQHSQGGYNPNMHQPYSPMPPHAQPAGGFPHMPPGHGTPQGYAASPRPPMMQHSSSQQGFQPPMGGLMQGPPFAPGPGQPPPHHWQRQMSGGGHGFPQMTPRQQQAQIAAHPSPGMGAAGDEGK